MLTCFPLPSRTLVNLLLNSPDALVLAVACADVGQYVKHCERGKKSVQPSPFRSGLIWRARY